MQQVLVLNASYEPLNVCTVRRAHVLVFKGKAEVLEDLPRPLRSASDTFRWPHVIRLHVVPRSRGGDSVWENVVTSCAPCNLRKGNRLLEEVQMNLIAAPRPPAPALFVTLSAPKIPDGWQPYLVAFG
jgi:hypothetical protein